MMRVLKNLVAITLALATAGCDPAPPVHGRLPVQHIASNDPRHESYRRDLESSGLYQSIGDEIADRYRLPRDVLVSFEPCGEVNAFYLAADPPAIVICYEALVDMDARFAQFQLSDDQHSLALTNTITFIYLHELGHALIHQLRLPVTGRDEDAVDQLATLLLIDASAGASALDGAIWFRLRQRQRGPKVPLWDEHGLDDQRFYNIVCWVYGSNPVGFGRLPDLYGLPRERAERCPAEHAQLDAAWSALLAPHER